VTERFAEMPFFEVLEPASIRGPEVKHDLFTQLEAAWGPLLLAWLEAVPRLAFTRSLRLLRLGKWWHRQGRAG
jgi:hypothetical protein